MKHPETQHAVADLFSELALGASEGGSAFILNSGDVGLLLSLDALSALEASATVHGGASVAAHATHLSYGLGLMNRWAREGGNPFADARWDEAWKISGVSPQEWETIRAQLRIEVERWIQALASPREVDATELRGLIASVAHFAYHVGAMRQISKTLRGPREGTFR